MVKRRARLSELRRGAVVVSAEHPTRVVNVRYHQCDVRVDRKTIWGNPFYEGRDGTRDDVIDKYAAWVVTQPHLMAKLPGLRGKILGCWCVPAKRCHAEVLAALADGLHT
jgi:hypothetical protein